MTDIEKFRQAEADYERLEGEERALLAELQAAVAALVAIGCPIASAKTLERLRKEFTKVDKALRSAVDKVEGLERDLAEPRTFIGLDTDVVNAKSKNLRRAIEYARDEHDKAMAERTRLAKELLGLETRVKKWERETEYKPSALKRLLGATDERPQSELDNLRAQRDEIQRRLVAVRQAQDQALLDRAIHAPAFCDSAIGMSQAAIKKLEDRRAELEREQEELNERFREIDDQIRAHKRNISAAVRTERWAQDLIEREAEAITN